MRTRPAVTDDAKQKRTVFIADPPRTFEPEDDPLPATYIFRAETFLCEATGMNVKVYSGIQWGFQVDLVG